LNNRESYPTEIEKGDATMLPNIDELYKYSKLDNNKLFPAI